MLEIPWKIFSEEEIHLILTAFFESLGYKVYNQHRIQRVIEKGADLIISKAGKGKIAIAAKIRPEKKDIYQMIELSRRKEKDKIYIYCDNPTRDFISEMSKFRGKITFWDQKKLTKKFFELNPFFASNLVINNLPIMRILTEIRNIFAIIYSEGKKRKKGFKKLDRKSLHMLWRLKDFSVMFHKINELLQLSFFEKDSMRKLNKRTQLYILENYVDLLDSMESHAINFREVLKDFWHKNKDFLSFVAQETRARSNWIYIFAFDTISSGNIRRQYEEGEKIRKSLKKLEKISKVKSNKENSNIIDCLEENSRYLNIFGWAIEATIDDFLSYAFYRKMSRYL